MKRTIRRITEITIETHEIRTMRLGTGIAGSGAIPQDFTDENGTRLLGDGEAREMVQTIKAIFEERGINEESTT